MLYTIAIFNIAPYIITNGAKLLIRFKSAPLQKLLLVDISNSNHNIKTKVHLSKCNITRHYACDLNSNVD